ncbi:MAG: hypothetical protein MIO90_00030, partial [Methanomassiliicoccales archaeon]|nr:hypothetical protein [Methanomassiliicoccales archaeon]
GQDSEWSFDDGVVTMNAPMIVENNGFFDIDDVAVKFVLMDQNGKVLVRSDSDGTDIPAGGRTALDLGISLDLNDISRDELANIIFNGSDLRFEIGISAKYSLDLVRGSVTATSDLNWDPMVRDMDIRTEEAVPVYDGEGYFMYIPYSFFVSDMVEGQPMLVRMSFEDGMGNVTMVDTVVQPYQYYQGTAMVPISMDTYDRLMSSPENLSASLTLGFMDCSKTVNENWGWTP